MLDRKKTVAAASAAVAVAGLALGLFVALRPGPAASPPAAAAPPFRRGHMAQSAGL